MRKLLLSILLILPLTYALAGQPVGCKMKADPHMQEKAINPGPDFPFAVGDTIVISTTQTHYLTGEKMSNWVYYVMHTIKQVGGKRFPQGVLIDGIMSWVDPSEGLLLLVNPVERADSAQNAAIYRIMHADEIAAAEEAAAREQAVKDSIALEQKMREEQARVPVTHEDSVREGLVSEPNEDEIINRMHEEALRQADSIARYRHNFHKDKEHRFSIGVRGGVASLMQKTQDDMMGNWRAGGDGMLDLQYAYYAGAKENQSCNFGFITGISVGYGNSGLRSSVRDSFSIGDTVQYQISAKDVHERDGQIQLEVPLLFSLRHENGLFFNVGPRFMLPVYSHYKQTIAPDADETYIDAYFVNEGVHVVNKPVTGELTDADRNIKDSREFKKTSKLHIMLTSEIGYEWALRNGHNLGLGVYANYSLYNLYKNDNVTTNSLIQVPNGPHANGAQVDVLSATDAYANKQGFFDCGLKLVYHFCFPVK